MQAFINLSPRQCFKQMSLIKTALDKWLSVTDVMAIRKRVAKAIPVPDDATADQKRAIVEKFRERQMAQSSQNLEDIFNAIICENPEETLELMALICCVPPEEVDEHPIKEYLSTIMETLSDKVAMDFFSLSMQWERMGSQG